MRQGQYFLARLTEISHSKPSDQILSLYLTASDITSVVVFVVVCFILLNHLLTS